ncbi:MAG: LysM peptidoglycan-binding domain-containing protein [Planctomycetes bacterium]|nr:LysM peptidoglycan-binding domain-containing protein [Planctomycetota bacterium]
MTDGSKGMGKETKVGLLVGMCFIVCCAIVLSHHGRRRAVAQGLSMTDSQRTREAPLPVDRSTGAEHATKRLSSERTPTRNERRSTTRPTVGRPKETVLAESGDSAEAAWSDGLASRAPRTSPSDSASSRFGSSADLDGPFIHRGPPIPGIVSQEGSLSDRRSGSDVIVLDDAGENSRPMLAILPEREREKAALPDGGGSDGNPSGLSTLTSTSPRTTEPLPTRQPAPQRSQNSQDVEDRRNRSGSSENRTASLDRHIVQPGDNLSRIAEQYYGSSDPQIMSAILAANGQTMKSADHIVVGQELVLPHIEGVELQATTEHTVADPIDSRATAVPETSILAEYEVQPGDSFSKIASLHYGSASKRIIDAVLAANRDTVKSADHLLAGTVLKLPEIALVGEEGRTPSDAANSDRRAAQASKSGSANESARSVQSGFRWYQVQKGDVLSTIAAAELGTSKRWKELAEFNKDLFPKPSHIRHGARIRIPTSAASESNAHPSRRSRP